MPSNLYDTAVKIRQGVVVVLIVVILVLIGDAVIKFLNSDKSPFFVEQSPYLDPNYALLDVPVPNIPTLTIDDNSKPTYIFDGVFSDFPDSAFVYTVERPREKLDTIQQATKTANTVGFTAAYSEVTTEDLQWQNSAQTRTLTFNRNTQAWKLRTQYFLDAEAQKPKTVLADITSYESKARSVISSMGFSDQSLNRGKIEAKFAKLGIDGLFTNPINPSSADYIVVDVYRQLDMSRLKSASQRPTQTTGTEPKDYDGYVYKDDPRIGSLNMVLTGQASDLTKDLYALDFVNYEYNYNYGIYGIISAKEAWDQVRLGKGALRLLQPATADFFSPSQALNVTRFVADASKTELAYWEPPLSDGTRFIYPIYIFRGTAELADNSAPANFVFYMDALKR